MSFIWHRKGYLVPLALLIGVLVELLLFGVSYAFVKVDIVRKIFEIMSVASLFLPALLNHLFTKFFVDDKEVREVKDSDGKIILVKDFSTFFYLRNRLWTRIFFYGVIVTMVCALLLGALGWVKPL
ncbi:hypothetical protein [Xylocopilactobacillus apicola]|uniref:DUF3899 domain-containing protein n=1 Tax=Xylocopilactobacillus apicola TaxID=2932184 RepID=A0AAU9DSA7_9LACO|nr:hypothetical protein [Xylocopilactobacillus apicola]BDR58894.1 hypothetical protein XA3_13350 [Xylocopilactobacillus apicola]